jgi:hypothetical protein
MTRHCRHLLRTLGAAALALAGLAPAVAQDRMELEDTKIIGNRELPKVLYLVPWKKPLPGDLAGKPPASIVDEALAPIDREEFSRQIRYDAQLARRLPIDTPVTEKPATRAPRAPMRPRL